MNRSIVERSNHLALACGAVLLAIGCGGEESARLVDFLDELEFDVPLETAAYVSLGRYDVPVSATGGAEHVSKFMQQVGDEHLVMMRLQFELTAETKPEHEAEIQALAEKHRGALSDAVLTIVRTSTVDELADPRLAAINAKLSDVARPLFGKELVRQYVLNDPATVEAQEKAKQKASHGDGHGGGHGDEGGHGEESHGEEEHGAEGHAKEVHGEEEHGDDAHGHH